MGFRVKKASETFTSAAAGEKSLSPSLTAKSAAGGMFGCLRS